MPGGKKHRGGSDRKNKVRFRVVQQSYEDKDYQGEPKPVLVPAAMIENRRPRKHPMFRFGDGLPVDYSNKRNMTTNDDTAEGDENIFDGAVEAEFDEKFIAQMMEAPESSGDGGEDVDESADGARREASKHDKSSHRVLERQFDRAMREFLMDEEIDEEDPRVQGPLNVLAYSAALQQFMEEHAGETFDDDDEHATHRGLINQLRALSREHNIFDSDHRGEFLAALPNKLDRMKSEFLQNKDELKKLTLQHVATGVVRASVDEDPSSTAAVSNADGKKNHNLRDDAEVIEVKAPRGDRVDCETVLSSYSTLYNHPNVIAAEKKKINMKSAITATVRPKVVPTEAKARPAISEEVLPVVDDDEEDPPAMVEEEVKRTTRNPNETSEEKAARRKAVKQYQAERRQAKKALKGAFHAAHLDQLALDERSRRGKGQVSLSSVAHAS